jgi:starch synthase|uniref:Glycosyltransferase family 1 protein n=1 Tax=Desulfobacca acetoxidans TaxID=60893 RepID=A0A7C3SK56_9BACT
MNAAGLPLIVLSNPDARPAAYELALAAQEHGVLKKFFTGYYCKAGPLLQVLEKSLPPALWARLWRQLRRRTHGLAPEAVDCARIFELLQQISAKFVRFKSLQNLLRQSLTLFFDFQVARQLPRLEFDIFIFFNDTAASYSLPRAKSLGKLTVLRSEIPHGRDWLALCQEERRLAPHLWQRSADDKFESWLFKRRLKEFAEADFILANSPFVKNSLIRNGVRPEKIYVLPGGADLEKFAPSPGVSLSPRKPFQILFVGGICPRKGVHYLLQAFRHLNLPGGQLTLVGPVVEPRLLAEAADLNGRFRHIPAVPHHEIPRWFAQADLFVFPTLLEGSAYVTYEAMAAGLPVVTTPNAGSYVRHGLDGFIVPVRNPDALREAIRFLYRNKEARRRLGANARERARLFTWCRYRQNVMAVLSHIKKHGVLPPPVPEYDAVAGHLHVFNFSRSS